MPNLELTDKDYERLLTLVHLGDWLINSYRLPGPEMKEEYRELLSKVCSQADLFHRAKLVSKDSDGTYDVNSDFEMREDHMDFIDEYNERNFWDELTEHLVDRDTDELYSDKEWSKLKHEQPYWIRRSLGEKYEQEFRTHDTDRLRVVGDGETIVKQPKEPLPQIVFSFFGMDQPKLGPIHEDLICAVCGKKGIRPGVYEKNPLMDFIACEECAIDGCKLSGGFTSREEAAARRRRIFDVGYLFVELFAKKIYGLDATSSQEIEREVFEKISQEAYQAYEKIPKEMKLKIEEIPDQHDLEKALDKYVKKP